MSDEGPREEDGDYSGEFFGTYEREADRGVRVIDSGCRQDCSSWFGFFCDCGGRHH